MKCHICEKEDIEDKGIFEEPICFECWEKNKESFYEQTSEILQKNIEHPKVGYKFTFTEQKIVEMCKYVKNDNRVRW